MHKQEGGGGGVGGGVFLMLCLSARRCNGLNEGHAKLNLCYPKCISSLRLFSLKLLSFNNQKNLKFLFV